MDERMPEQSESPAPSLDTSGGVSISEHIHYQEQAHGRTYHTIQWGQFNQSVLLRRIWLGMLGFWETIWRLAEDLKSMWKPESTGEVMPFIILAESGPITDPCS